MLHLAFYAMCVWPVTQVFRVTFSSDKTQWVTRDVNPPYPPGEKPHGTESKETYLTLPVRNTCWSVHICTHLSVRICCRPRHIALVWQALPVDVRPKTWRYRTSSCADYTDTGGSDIPVHAAIILLARMYYILRKCRIHSHKAWPNFQSIWKTQTLEPCGNMVMFIVETCLWG